MERTEISNCRSEKGFTLVELAIVMIIIGLLIGGILKGQELISNAQVAATVAQVKAIDAATTTFRDKYDALPGDLLNPTVRLANCGAAPCSDAGDGNGRLDNAPGAADVSGPNEGGRFFIHLNASDLITGIRGAATTAWGDAYPEAEIGGGFTPGYNGGGGLGENANASAGHYLALTLTAEAFNDDVLTANQAARVDRKLDDGSSNTGTVFTNDVGCNVGAAAGSVYDESNTAAACDLFIRFQG